MNTDVLTSIILEQQAITEKVPLIKRTFDFEEHVNYVLVGLRRAGKSYLLFQRIQELIRRGVDPTQIIYVNFEDERLIDFELADFNSIILAANQITAKKHYYFFDEIQNIDGWERFARRMADQHETVYITGSNSKMLGQDIMMRLGGRYLAKYVSPFTFDEYLTGKEIAHDKNNLLVTANLGVIQNALNTYLHFGGLPETINLVDKRNYLNNIYQNIYLADIAVRNSIRNPESLRILIQKIAEIVMHEVSYTRLYTSVKSVGVSTSKSSIIDYTNFAQSAYLLFKTKNYFSKFSNRESTPRFYFTDNGILNLFLINHDAALLENIVAIKLFNQYQTDLYYLKSSKTGIDIDFYVPQTKTAIQVAWTINNSSREREIKNLIKASQSFKENVTNLVLVTKNDREEEITVNNSKIHSIPLFKFLLQQNG